MTNSRRALTVTCTHLVLIAAGIAYGGYRYQQIQSDRQLPEPAVLPVSISPQHQDAQLISDADLLRVLDKLKPRLAAGRPSINHVDHALRFWGIEAAFDDPACLSGIALRELLLDHRSFSSAWGPETEPLLTIDSNSKQGFAFRTRQGPASASHIDHTLAGLAEVGTPSDFPVLTPNGEIPLRAALSQCLRDFHLNQEEYEWSALVWLLYYPHVREWTTTEGQTVNWDRMAERLQRQRLPQGVCFGQHRLFALAALLQRDETEHYLSPVVRQQVLNHLQDVTLRMVATQHSDGYWDGSWPGAEWDGVASPVTGPMGSTADRILATGHVLEWWLYAPDDVLPPRDVIERASTWLVQSIEALTPQETRKFYPFLTHAGRALSLWHGHEPHVFLSSATQNSER